MAPPDLATEAQPSGPAQGLGTDDAAKDIAAQMAAMQKYLDNEAKKRQKEPFCSPGPR